MWQAFKHALLTLSWPWLSKQPFETVQLPGWWCVFDPSGRIHHLSPTLKRLVEAQETAAFRLWEDPDSPFVDTFQQQVQTAFQKLSKTPQQTPCWEDIHLERETFAVCLWQLETSTHWILWIPNRTVPRPIQRQGNTPFEKRLSLTDVSEILQGFPLILWHRNHIQRVNFCNLIYHDSQHPALRAFLRSQEKFFTSKPATLLVQKAQQIQKPQRGYYAIQQKTQRYAFEIWEKPDLKTHGTWGVGIDISAHEKQRKSMAKRLNVFKKTMASIPQGIVFFDQHKRLSYANKSLQTLFHLNRDWIAKEPSFEDFFDTLRYQRMIPEVSDFSAYKKRLLSLFQEKRCVEELLHLPDERSIKMRLIPNTSSGLTLIFEDISQQFVFERQYNSLLATQQTLLANLQEGVLIFGVDQRMVTFNNALESLLFPDESVLEKGMHLEVYLRKKRKLFSNPGSFEGFKKKLLTAISQHVFCAGACHLKNKRSLIFTYIPLPSGDHLLIYQPTAIAPKNEALFEEAIALWNSNWELKECKKNIDFRDLQSALRPLEKIFSHLIHKKKLLLKWPATTIPLALQNPLQKENLFRFLYYLLGYIFQKAPPKSRIVFNYQHDKRSLEIIFRAQTPVLQHYPLLEAFAGGCNLHFFCHSKGKGKLSFICKFKK